MTTILGPVHDSSGRPANGTIEWRQTVRFGLDSASITRTIAVSQVVGGEIKAEDGGAFTLPPNPIGSRVHVLEVLGGHTHERMVEVPDAATVLYRDLDSTPVQAGEIWVSPGGAIPNEARSRDLLFDPTTQNVYRIRE
ncbi:hypothetical protein [Lysinibacter cavernae]|uniref:Uncharacterized protein n=1 Tax=Lysinibacter cavernae TaxID=1640652 RepID=A0A7X5R194_9MICO|nr:hypothetical protein [Lysinibacter cavernae]NIH53746.1 hypothetical protein [Lysinibacter cavernae]